jgi:hypothetical protein
MNDRPKLKPCPWCGRNISMIVTNDEGNHKPDDYADDPWAGLGFVLSHECNDKLYCPIATHEGEDLGAIIYDTAEEAAAIWNTRNGGFR